jgi:hypothetical protein
MLSKDYILGFVEGEGCFSIGIGRYIDRRPKVRAKPSNIKNPYLFLIKPMFVITNVEANKALLERIKDTIGVGRVYVTNRGQNASQQNVAQYRVQAFGDCRKVVDYFADTHFETEKGKDYLNWSKCLDIIEKGDHLTKEGILEICSLRDQMNFRKTKNKWTTEEVRKILEEKPLHQSAFFDANQQSLIHNNIEDKTDLKEWLTLKQGNNKPSRFTSP